jgi:hypothetical protein
MFAGKNAGKDEKKKTATKDERRYDKFNSKAGSRSILFTKSYCAQEIQRLDENRCRSWIIVGFARSTIWSFCA